MLRNLRGFSFKTAKILLLALASISLLITVGLLSLHNANHIGNLSKFISNHGIYFMVWRYFLMSLVVYIYPKFLRAYVKSKPDIDEVKLTKLCQRRWIILAFIIYELVVAHDFLSVFVNWVIGS